MVKRATVTAFLVLCGFIVSCRPPAIPQKTALLFGVSIYNEGVSATARPNLPAVANDVKELETVLKQKGWTTNSFLADSAEREHNQNTASKAAIEKAISALRGVTGPVLFYFSGHGVNLGDTTHTVSSIIPHPSIPDNYLNDAISETELRSMFSAAGLRHVILILDCCESGGFASAGPTVDAIPQDYAKTILGQNERYTLFIDALTDSVRAYTRYSPGHQFIAITAAGSAEASWELGGAIRHGIFTYAILKAASSPYADFDRNKSVTTSELYTYCSLYIQKAWNTKNNPNAHTTTGDEANYYHPHVSGSPREYALWTIP